MTKVEAKQAGKICTNEMLKDKIKEFKFHNLGGSVSTETIEHFARLCESSMETLQGIKFEILGRRISSPILREKTRLDTIVN